MMSFATRIPPLQTARLTLCAPVPGDFDAYAAFHADPRSAAVGGPLRRPAAWQAFAAMLGHWVIRGFGMRVGRLRSTGAAIGLFGTYWPDGYPHCEIGWQVWPRALLGQGLATEAGRALLAAPHRTPLVSYIAPDNLASIRVAHKLGATLDPTMPAPFDGVQVHSYATETP